MADEENQVTSTPVDRVYEHGFYGENVSVENGDVVNAVNELKSTDGKDIVVYGGAGFVSSLLDHGLIDELNLFINPTAIGSGMRIFSDRAKLKLVNSEAYRSGIVVNTYVPEG